MESSVRTRWVRRLILTAGVVSTCLWSSTALARGQDAAPPSLAELAKKEQQRRKDIKDTGSVKVFTDKGAKGGAAAPPVPPSVPAGAGALPPAAPAGAESRSAADSEGSEAGLKGETAWRERMTQARDELRRNELFAEALQTRVNSLSGDFVARDDPYQRAKIAEDRQKALDEMSRLKADVERGKKQIANIEEEARMAGVPPGWLR